MQLFLHEGKQLFAINLFNRDFISTYEGLRIGLVIGLKVMGASALTWSFIAVTPFHHMLAVMKWMHIPEVFTELTMLMFRYLFVLLEAVVNIRNAQVLRSGYTRTQQAMRSFSMLAGMTFIKTWEQANQTAQAMDCRGYQGKVYIQPLVQFTFWHYGQVVIGVIFSFLIYVWQYNFRG